MVTLILFCLGILVAKLPLIWAGVPLCDKINPDFTASPYCLPDDYNLDIIPPMDGSLNINVDIFVFEVSKIDDIALSMTFELYFDLTWTESRLIINDSAPEWAPDGSVMGSTNFVKSMWLPDIQILNLKQFQKRQIVTDVAGLIIHKNRLVLYTVSTEAVISCPMKFSAYPLDKQECKFLVGSYIHDATQISFTGTFGHDTVNQRAQQYEIEIAELDDLDKWTEWAHRNFSYTGFNINLKRRRTPVLLQTYLPSGLFVVVSWISFIVPPEIVPGRMALLVTLFLVLVNIFNSVTANAPKSEGLTAVETWVVMCILHVFCVLLEYAIILKILQIEKRKMTARMRKVDKANTALSASNTSLNNKSLLSAETSPEPNVMLNRLTRCLKPSTCCKETTREHSINGQAHETEALCERSAQNCSCDEAHHHKNNRKTRVKGASPPTPPTEQIFEADSQYNSAQHVGGNGAGTTRSQGISAPAPHHPFIHECNYPRHRHAHPPHRHGFFTTTGSGGGSHTPTRPPPSLQLNTFAGGGASDDQQTWTKIDLAALAAASSREANTSHNETSPTPSVNVRKNTDYLRVSAKTEKIDRIAMWLFPIIFFLFNVCYWSYFLLLVDVLEDLWNCGGFGDCEKPKMQCDNFAYACDE